MFEQTNLSSVSEIEHFIKDNEFCLLYFSKQNCSVCHGLLPQVQSILERYPQIKFGHIDTDEVQQVASMFSIFTVPVILCFIEGKEVIREARIVHLDIFEEKLQKYYQQ